MKKLLTFILVLAAVLSVSSIALAADDAATINGTGYATLKDALAAAKDGDTINIAAGTHTLDKEIVRITGKSVTLIGAGQDQTFIESEKYGFVLQGHPDKPITYTLKDMTIKSGCCTVTGHNNCDWAQPLYVKGNTTVYLEDVTLHNAGTGTTAILVDSANQNSDLVYENGITATVNATNVTVDTDDKILLYANPSNLTTAVSGKAAFNYSNCKNILDNNIEGQEDYNKGIDNLLVNGESINPAVAQIGATKYATLQAAINDAPNQGNDVTIELLADITESVIIRQKDGLNLTIDGNEFAMSNPSGKNYIIGIDGDGRKSGTDKLSIKDVVFNFSGDGNVILSDPHVDKFGSTNAYLYAHKVTIQECEFNLGTGVAVAVKIRQGADITITGCEMNDGHSLFQCINCDRATIENTTVSGASEGGVNIENSTGVIVRGCTFECGLYGVRGGADGGAKGDVTIEGTSIKAKYPIIMRNQKTKDAYTLNIEDEGNALTPHWDNTTEPTYSEEAPIYVTEGNVTPSAAAAYNKGNLKQVGGIAAWNKDTNTYYTGWRAAIADAKPGETVYPVKDGKINEDGAETIPEPTKPSGSGISITYNGGNSFSTSNPTVPTGVEIDGVPVTFNGTGSNFSVGCISSDAKWVTVRWNSTSVTTNFTPDGLVECTTVSIPKTGDMSIWAAIAEFLGF